MENLFSLHFAPEEIRDFSNLGLAHLGDGVYELMCRSYLCIRGDRTVGRLHQDTVAMVNAHTQARFADRMLGELTPEELAYYRRGKNSHTHAVPKNTSPMEYARATGVETLFGALYLEGKKDRLEELFRILTEEVLTDGV